MIYKGMMLGGVPNLAFALGYTNASWTLKADLSSEFVCKLLRRMDESGAVQCIPRQDPAVEAEPFFDFSSGYVRRAAEKMPKSGSKAPWKLNMNYLVDLWDSHQDVEDGILEMWLPNGERVTRCPSMLFRRAAFYLSCSVCISMGLQYLI